MDPYDEWTMQRLTERTDRSGDCWLWTAGTGSTGYGKLGYRSKIIDAHRVAWMLHNGPIPDGMVIAHHCDVRRCVRPDHLFLATHAENLADMRSKRRHSSGPKHAEAIRSGWTPELRARRAEQTRSRMKAVREEAALAAGVPLDWKRCPGCDTWKPRSDYQKNRARDDGIKPICRPCAGAQSQMLAARRRVRSGQRSQSAMN